MRKLFLFIFAVGLVGCASTSSVHEQNDLVTIAHNNHTDYTLITYRSTEGYLRKVLRRDGVFELLLMENEKGDFYLKEKGQEPRRLTARNLIDLEASLQELIYDTAVPTQQAPPAQGSS